jgi:hypothetical protein
MTHTDSATGKSWLRSVSVMDVPREQAIPLGITELFKWCEEEHRTNPEAIPIPPKAFEYWTTARQTGGQLYEIQSNLEAFGLTFGVKPIEETPAAPKLNGRASRNGVPAKPAVSNGKVDLTSLIKQQLAFLNERQKEIVADQKALRTEYQDNQANIDQFMQFLLLSQPKKRGKKADVTVQG